MYHLFQQQYKHVVGEYLFDFFVVLSIFLGDRFESVDILSSCSVVLIFFIIRLFDVVFIDMICDNEL